MVRLGGDWMSRWCWAWLPAAALGFLVACAPSPPEAQEMSFDPERGVITLAPLLERVTPAVVNIAVVSRW